LYKISEEIQFIGKQVIFLPKCRSTNDIAAEMLNKGVLSEGSIIITDHQYAGRGQRGNVWNSEANKNLTFSVVLKPSFILPRDNFYLNIISSLSIIEALQQPGFESFKIKWPNDIFYKNHKIGGILIENNIQSGKIENSIVGIGLNVNQTDFDEIPQATSLNAIFKKTVNINDMLNRIILQFEKTYFKLKDNHLQDLKKRYTTNLYWINEAHTFRSSITFMGEIMGIDDYGRLEVNIDGNKKKFKFKEITYLK
jgi:BirA family biotin operon repressor/biotin-[acetyl-CoA-carboxylase] ligase